MGTDQPRQLASGDLRLPLVLSVIAAITFLLLFLLTGSVVLPLKALLLNVLSLTAAFGALVWIFQNGHLGAFGTTATGTLVASVPVLLFCLAFGLSMGYEVFLISRIRESWLATGRTRADNDESVALGLARTGRVVTAAALLMGVTFASLVAADVSVMRMFGVGVPLAVLVDATLVRMLLMPAFMRVLGRGELVGAGTAGAAASTVRHQRIPPLAVPLRPQLHANDRVVTDAMSLAGAVPLRDGLPSEGVALSS